MLSDLRIIFSICTAIRNIHNVHVASAMDAMCPWGRHGKIKLLDLSEKALRILSVLISGALLYLIRECPYCPYTHPGCPCGILNILGASMEKYIHKNIAGSAID